MLIIAHRRNKREELRAASTDCGIEVDIRSHGDDLIIHHDPFAAGELFTDWIKDFRHKTLILNVKEEGLEERLLQIMHDRRIDDFFFLDQSFPFLVKTSKTGETRCAVRVSEFESIDTALTLAGKVDWVWVDCFTRFALSAEEAQRLHEAGFRLCVVSPELQGRDPEVEIPLLVQLMADRKIFPAAVCSKRPDLWR